MITKRIAATVSVEWGDELHSITVSPRFWDRIKAGKEIRIRGKGYWYEAEFFWDYWCFGGGMDGSLQVDYGDDAGVGFEGSLRDATVVEHAWHNRPRSAGSHRARKSHR